MLFVRPLLQDTQYVTSQFFGVVAFSAFFAMYIPPIFSDLILAQDIGIKTLSFGIVDSYRKMAYNKKTRAGR